MGNVCQQFLQNLVGSVVGLKSGPVLKSSSSPYFWDSDLDSKSLDSDLTNGLGLGLEMIRAAMSYGGIDICLL